MLKYYTYEKVETSYTVLEVRVGHEDVKICYFTYTEKPVVAISGEEEAIDALISAQDPRTNATEIDQQTYDALIAPSDQVRNIYRQVEYVRDNGGTAEECDALLVSLMDEIGYMGG
ncbi:MAG TPA: hypothetical protein CFH81_00510 [Sulfurovum sp. UBA12169]|nr:MAG TPA: hypothetical protein CFH81_00510 [Sulfurovum sp. UBA12169]